MLAVLAATSLILHNLVARAFADQPPPTTLNITAIATNSQQESILECWQLDAPFKASAAAGTTGAVFAQLGSTNMSSLGVIPARFSGGLHTAPGMQYVAFISGQAVISLPNSSQTATVYGGKHGLIFAADTPDKSKLGHYTDYPGTDNTVALQLPTLENVAPAHTVLREGPCCIDDDQVF